MDLVVELKSQLATLGVVLPEETLLAEISFVSELLKWNKTYNLTAIIDPYEAIEKHLVDSLSLLPYLAHEETLIDIGSGGGFPGIPLQIALPELKVVSVDSVAKKIVFQRHVARRLALRGFTPWHGRVEQVTQQPFAVDGFDLVTARAFAPLQTLLELALPLLKPGGRIAAMKGAEAEKELSEAGDWLAERGVCCRQQVSLQLPRSGARRHLMFFGFETQDIE